MTKNTVPNVSQPNYFRPATNTGSDPIKPGYIVAISGAYPGCKQATGGTDKIYAVSVEEIGPGQTRSVQVDGCVPVVAGAAIERGANLTSDSSGRAVTAGEDDTVLGTAAVDVAAAGDWAAIELGR